MPIYIDSNIGYRDVYRVVNIYVVVAEVKNENLFIVVVNVLVLVLDY